MTTNRLSLLIITLAIFSSIEISVSAEAIPVPPVDARIRSLLYVPGQVVRLHGWVGYHIDIVFEPGEALVTVGGGDLEALTYGAVDNHFFLKPRAARVKTNLTVVTNRRTYVLDYTVSAGVPDVHSDDIVYSLRFTYPPPGVGPSNAQRIAEDFAAAPEHAVRNVDYWFCGEPGLQPSPPPTTAFTRDCALVNVPRSRRSFSDPTMAWNRSSISASMRVTSSFIARRAASSSDAASSWAASSTRDTAEPGSDLSPVPVSPHVRRETQAVRP